MVDEAVEGLRGEAVVDLGHGRSGERGSAAVYPDAAPRETAGQARPKHPDGWKRLKSYPRVIARPRG
jgi:hypothetical protein